jgi:hypothetical protein
MLFSHPQQRSTQVSTPGSSRRRDCVSGRGQTRDAVQESRRAQLIGRQSFVPHRSVHNQRALPASLASPAAARSCRNGRRRSSRHPCGLLALRHRRPRAGQPLRARAPLPSPPTTPAPVDPARHGSLRPVSFCFLPPLSLLSFFAWRSRSLPPRPLFSPLSTTSSGVEGGCFGRGAAPRSGPAGGGRDEVVGEEPAGAAAGQQRRHHRCHAAVPLRPQFRQGQILRHPPRCVALRCVRHLSSACQEKWRWWGLRGLR